MLTFPILFLSYFVFDVHYDVDVRVHDVLDVSVHDVVVV